MDYIKVTIPCCDAGQAEIHVAELAQMPFESFELTDIAISGYIRGDEYEKYCDEIGAYLRSTGVECRTETIAQQNWNRIWEESFEPVEIGNRCTIRAPFHPAPPEGVMDIGIMPKMSFGTGHHATTCLVAEEMFDHGVSGCGLDMGSGTGVLAIIAVKLGARAVDAVDIDEWAFENCGENARDNGVGEKVTPILGDVGAIEGRRYDFILANINRNILVQDMRSYAEMLLPGGTLTVSGFLEQDAGAVGDAARSWGFDELSRRQKDGWVAITFTKP